LPGSDGRHALHGHHDRDQGDEQDADELHDVSADGTPSAGFDQTAARAFRCVFFHG
jgi:hypothetical protein